MAYENSNSFVKGTPCTRGKSVKNGVDLDIKHNCFCGALWHMCEAVQCHMRWGHRLARKRVMMEFFFLVQIVMDENDQKTVTMVFQKDVGFDSSTRNKNMSKHYFDVGLATVPYEDISEAEAAEMNLEALKELAKKSNTQ